MLHESGTFSCTSPHPEALHWHGASSAEWVHDLSHPVFSAMEFLWWLVQIPKRSSDWLSSQQGLVPLVLASILGPVSQGKEEGLVIDCLFQGHRKCRVSEGLNGWRRYRNLSQRGLTSLQGYFPLHTCVHKCECNPFTWVTHHEDTWLRLGIQNFLLGHPVLPASRSCLKLFHLFQKGSPQLAKAPQSVCRYYSLISEFTLDFIPFPDSTILN